MISQSRDQQREGRVGEDSGRQARSAGYHGGDVNQSELDDDGMNSARATVGSQASSSGVRSRASSVTPSIHRGPAAQILLHHKHQKQQHLPRRSGSGGYGLSTGDVQRMDHDRDYDRDQDHGRDQDDRMLLRGLTPPPWPADLTPHSKRPRDVQEVIEDDSPRAKDKMSEELEEIELAVNAATAAAAATEDDEMNPDRGRQNKRIRLSSRPKGRGIAADPGSYGGPVSVASTKHGRPGNNNGRPEGE